MKNDRELQWHNHNGLDLLELLETSLINGLASSEADNRIIKYGQNCLSQKSSANPLILFLSQFNQPLVYILLGSAITTSFLGEWLDAGVIYGVVFVNAFIGFIQEIKAVRAIEVLSHSLGSSATVIRDNVRKQISSSYLVPGDVVLLKSGDVVPADLRLLSVRDLQVNESALTGESLPVIKKTDPLDCETQLADRINMAYSSTLVTNGVATGLVVATGDSTEIGQVNKLIATADILATPLTKKISHFSTILLYIIITFALLTFGVGILRGQLWLDMFMAAVALAVGAIPEGLPAAVTITLAIGVARMAKRNVIIRNLPAVETLGSTTVICSDKTGTLTQNQMTVREIYAGGVNYEVSGNGYEPKGSFSGADNHLNPQQQTLLNCLKAGMLCNDATLKRSDSEWQIEGDPTEGALLVAAEKAGLSSQLLMAAFPRLDAIPFESEYQYMATMHTVDGKQMVYLKGAIESIIPRCSFVLSEKNDLMPFESTECYLHAARMSEKALRVLAFACVELADYSGTLKHDDLNSGLIFLGLQGMIDPPRPEAIAAVKACQAAGIQVKMITGDHAVTAAAIARQIGLSGIGGTLTGVELKNMTDTEFATAVQRFGVFARVAPAQKLLLVKVLQGVGHIVAMTGDGVNDAPALRQADIGVAMAMTGTGVAKETADMLLLDDNFASIEAAVEEGRGIFDNLVKFIIWTLPTNLGEGLVIMAAVFTGAQLPITPVQILWINMTTAVLLGLMLAFEPKEHGLMVRPPNSPHKPLLTGELIMRIILVGFLLLVGSFGIFEWQLHQGHSVESARTCAVNIFVFGEIFYLFNCRSLSHSMFHVGVLSNAWVLGGVSLMVLLQFLFTYTPGMNRAFGSQPITLTDWVIIIFASSIVYCVIETEKLIRYRCKLNI